MEKENLILCCLFTLVAVCYSTLGRKHLYKIGKKLKTLNFNNKSETKMTKTNPNSLKLGKWYYRGEGNSYLTLSIPEARQILRIKKIFYPHGIKENFLYFLFKYTRFGNIIEANARIEEQENLKFYHTIKSLIGDAYVQPAREAILDRDDIEEIDSIINPLRPKHRKVKHLAYACGSLLADYAYFPLSWDIDDLSPTFSVEIKPKSGWIPPNEQKYPKCTYCLNQYIKFKGNETKEISNYCPMNLFSGNPERMRDAIKSLFEAPQNNFQIFKDGKLIYGDNLRNRNVMFEIFNFETFEANFQHLAQLLSKALTTNLSDDTCPNLRTQQKMYYQGDSECNFTDENILPEGCVLERILNIQKLDKWGAEIIYNQLKNQNFDLNYFTNPHQPLCKLNLEDDIASVVRQYLMAAVAKDLSLMITFKRILPGAVLNIPPQNIIKMDDGSEYAIQIGVFDLYPKKIASIEKHFRKRQQIAQIYQELVLKK